MSEPPEKRSLDDAEDELEPPDIYDPSSDIGPFVSALVLRPRPPFAEWVRAVTAGEAEHVPPSTVVLTPELLDDDELEQWLGQHHADVFERQLGHYTGPDRWPTERSPELLRAWFDIERVQVADDMQDHRLRPPITCEPFSLERLAEQFEAMPEESTLFVDVASGAVLVFTTHELDALEGYAPAVAGFDAETLDEMSRRYASSSLVPIVSSHDFDEIEAMAAFAHAHQVRGVRNRLLDALEAKKPARQFKNVIESARLGTQWREWRRTEVRMLLADLLDANDIPYVPRPDAEDAADPGR